jgi:hypothetical protein
MKNNLESKLLISIEPSEYIEYDEDKLFNALLYFSYHNLKHITPNDLPDIYIDIDTDICEDIGNYSGKTIVIDENALIIVLSSKNIRKASDDECCYKSAIKSLFHTFLHEFNHLQVIIESYLNSDKKTDFKTYSTIEYKKSLKEHKKLIREGFDPDEAYLNKSDEQEADWFAFKNLSLFENLYENDFLYTPQKAFMAKVRKVKHDTQISNNQNIVKMAQ